MTNEIGIYDHTTGEMVIREMTKDEQKLRDDEVTAFHAADAEKVEARLKAEIDKAALLAKLGITADEAKLLLS
jgi:hypothetical protein